MREVVRVGGCAWGLVAPGLGQLKPDTIWWLLTRDRAVKA